ncbi:MAG TPA: TonB-dependent receptor [Porphyromonadaceae bacterium]|jgi:hypothetical protein|nr:TonB-dependent receptor [Porphyromonadaceae bacterium]
MCKLRKRLLLFFTLAAGTLAAQNYTVSGYVTDAANGETLISATVIDKKTSKGAAANNYGYYSLTLPKGEVSLNYSYIGYETDEKTFVLDKDTVLNIALKLNNILDEVTVVGMRSEMGVKGSQMSAVEVPINLIKNIPTLLGENDLIKALQLLPGVQSGTEGSAGLYVRGGGPDENLLLLDGVPLYNVNHMLGFFSVFNSDALKNVTLYKGSFPARFGGRLSSVVDVRMKDGDDKKIRGTASIGLISSKIQLEGPIIREKTTFNVSARRTYIDVLTQPLIKAAAKAEGGDGNTAAGYYFYDVNAKFTHKFSDRDKLYLSAYLGDDALYAKVRTRVSYNMDFEDKDYTNLNWGWGNVVTALRWNHVVNNKLFMNTTASFTRYRSKLGLGAENVQTDKSKTPPKEEKSELNLTYNSGIRDWTAKMDFDYTPNSAHDIKFGTNYTYHTFRPDVTSMKFVDSEIVNKVDTVIGSPVVYAHETMSYIEDNVSIGNLLKVNLGVHFSTFHVQNQNYSSLQPRAGVRLLLTDNLSVKAGYAGMSQYIHLLSNSLVSLPTDLWVPVTKRIKPMNSHQYSAGLFYSMAGIADFSVEGYYKTMGNLLEYKDGASFMGISTNWEDKVSTGRGTAYGVELLAQRSFGNTTGWVGYTWSKSNRIFDEPGNELNNGKPFPAKYDRRHDISLTLTHKFSERIDLSGSWVFSTGNAATFAFHEVKGAGYPNLDNPYPVSVEIPHVSARNNFRYNSYHRMDLGVNFHKVTKRGNLRTWNISIYNVYNRWNPFFVYADSHSRQNPQTGEYETVNKLKQATLFPIIPSVSYTIKF